ncbi:rRNA maturation RNase YbeY [Maribacter algicola]|uniref:rRNA maturation RNase YbeY n=1 Tax=Meishania litoralis TaxID=3434685 RepID=A0ACC7LHV9_9FLAO
MIEFHYETDFNIANEVYYADWISRVIESELNFPSRIDFIFCEDGYLLSINQEYLDHDNYTDIITFDYSSGKQIEGDIFISVDRVKENAEKYDVDFEDELLRVMAHGVLHLMGYGDKGSVETEIMRGKEDEKIKMFHVEQ